MEEQRVQLDAQASVLPSGEFEIACISVGEAKGHGWKFGRAALAASVPLWNNAECFVDHAALGAPRSVRDLGGVLFNPVFDAATESVHARLRASGPSGALVVALGREMLAEGEHKPRVGFSADVLFTIEKDSKDVREILRVFSCDLVFDPARGGAFVRALNSVGTMERQNSLLYSESETFHRYAADSRKEAEVDEMKKDATPAAAGAVYGAVEIEKMRSELAALFSVEAERKKATEALQETRVAMSGHLLESALAASSLPDAMRSHVRQQFAGKVFEPKELTDAVASARKLLSELTAGQTVAGVQRVHGMYDSRDQLQAAVDDMLGAKRDKGAEGLQVAHLSGIKELYLMLTGDREFYGGYYPERAQFQATTATFTGLVKNALNKAVLDHWGNLGKAGYDWWTRVASIEHFDTLNGITWTIFGTVGALPSVAEGAEYTELKIGDSPETSVFTKYGGYVGITLEALDRDDTRKLKVLPRELANGALRNISSLVAALFTDAAGAGPNLADGGALFNSTAVTTAGGHANLLTTALGTDYAQWNTVALAMYNQPMLIANETGYYGTGKKMAVWPKFCLVPGALRGQADALFTPRWASIIGGNPSSAPLAGSTVWGGQVEVVTVPEWTELDWWAAAADPAIVPGIMVGERFGITPEVFVAGDELSPAVFMNDESRIKVRHFVAVGVCDWRPLHKETV